MAKYENSSEPKHSNKWFVDCGCSNHMTFNKSLFSSYTSGHPSSVELWNSTSEKIAGIGTIVVSIVVHGRKVRCMLKNVLHVLELGYQLLSVPTFDKQGLTTSIHSGRCWISNNSKRLATATMRGNLYELNLHTPTETALAATTIELWHHRLAHIQPVDINSMKNSHAVHGLETSSDISNPKVCSRCALGKAHRTAVPKKSHSRSTKCRKSEG